MSITGLSLEKLKSLSEEEQEAVYNKIAAVRKTYKAVNYAAVYGAGAPRIAITAGVSLARGEKLVEAYWKRNWSVKKIAEDQVVKTCMGTKWLYNPVSRLWYSLRYDKDRFSTLNQGTGVWCFDTWIKHVNKNGPPMIGQFHDEGIWLIKVGNRNRMTKHINKAMKEANKELNLNRELGCSIDFGATYASIH